jgi:hypothetical protein
MSHIGAGTKKPAFLRDEAIVYSMKSPNVKFGRSQACLPFRLRNDVLMKSPRVKF